MQTGDGKIRNRISLSCIKWKVPLERRDIRGFSIGKQGLVRLPFLKSGNSSSFLFFPCLISFPRDLLCLCTACM